LCGFGRGGEHEGREAVGGAVAEARLATGGGAAVEELVLKLR